MSLYEKFLAFETVILVKNKTEYNSFCKLMAQLGLKNIKYLSRLTFKELHKNTGTQVIPYGKLCVEFQLGKGFTVDSEENYLKYGVEVAHFDELVLDLISE